MVNIVRKPAPTAYKKKPAAKPKPQPKPKPAVKKVAAKPVVKKVPKPKAQQLKTKPAPKAAPLKAKTKTPIRTEAQALAFIDAIDTYGQLAAKIAKLEQQAKPIKLEVEQAYKKMIALADIAQADDAEELHHGYRYAVTIGAKGLKTEVSDRDKAVELLESISPGIVRKIATLPLGALKTYLPDEQYSSVTRKVYANKRPIKALQSLDTDAVGYG